MTPSHQITMLKFIKNMSMCSTVLDALHSADAIDFLIDVLSHSMKKGAKNFREVSNQVLNTMFNLCRLSKERQEYAASNGIIPLLLKIMKTERPPKEFVLPILCDMAHSGSKGRRYLWQNNGLDFYVSLLADQYWQVTALDAIFVWLQEETAKVESHLLEGSFTSAIVSCFSPAKANAFDANLLEPLLKVIRLSPAVAASLARAEMYAGIAHKLNHKKAVVRLNLLRLVRNIMDGCEANNLSMASSSTSSTGRQLRLLFDDIQTLADKDPAVLVRNLASELVRSHINAEIQHEAMALAGLGLGSSTSSSSNASSGPRPRSSARRNTSHTPPGPHLSMSMPPTPTHGHRQTQSSSSAVYIEGAAVTPKRSAVGLAQDRDPAFYRPRSREGLAVPSIPRRTSDTPPPGAASASASAAAAPTPSSKSRLSRTSASTAQYSPARPSFSSSTSAPIPIVAVGPAGAGGRRDSMVSTSTSSSYKESHLSGGHGRFRSGSSVTVASNASAGASPQYSASPTGGGGHVGHGGHGGQGGLLPPVMVGGYAASASRDNLVLGAGGGGGKRGSRAPGSDSRLS